MPFKRTLSALLLLLLLSTSMGFADAYKYIGSKNSEVYHYLNCSGTAKILDKNKVYFNSAAEAIADGRRPCAICTPPTTDDRSITAPAPAQISVSINGTRVAMSDMAPFIEGGRTYVPVRAVLEAYGVDSISYEAPNVIVVRGTDKLLIPVGEKCVIRNNVSMTTDAAAMIRNGRTCLPIRSVIEALGGTVGWDAETQTVLITKPSATSNASPGSSLQQLTVSFIDVGQGDSVF